jgi:hypothetical protein
MSTPEFWGDVSLLANQTGGVPEREITPYQHRVLTENELSILVLKTYILSEGEAAIREGDFISLEKEIWQDYQRGDLALLSGIGFLMLAPDGANLCLWAAETADVIVPRVYSFMDGQANLESAEVIGVFCSAEERVYRFENQEWLKFLGSERRDEDKIEYLNNFLVE